jgi:hypothetical protein
MMRLMKKMNKKPKLGCRWFGHNRWFVDDPLYPLDIVIGCTRCKDPSTFSILVHATENSAHPGYVNVQGFDKLLGFLEGQL